MSLPKVLAIGMVVGLVAMLISLAGVLAQGGEGTVTIRDSDDTNYSDLLSGSWRTHMKALGGG